MRSLVCAALLCAAGSAMSASLIAKQGNDWVRIYNQPCTDEKVLDRIPEPSRKGFQKANAMVGGKVYSACWAAGNGGVHLVYDDGDQGIVPFGDLKEDLGV
jgi:hypothetical protein